MTVNEAVRKLLGDAREGVALDTLHAEAQRKGIRIGRNTIATARRGEIGKPTSRTIDALATLFGVNPEKLREAIGVPPLRRRWEPPEEAHSLTPEVQDALDVLIKRIVKSEGGQSWDAGEPSGPEDDEGAGAPDNVTDLRDPANNPYLGSKAAHTPKRKK